MRMVGNAARRRAQRRLLAEEAQPRVDIIRLKNNGRPGEVVFPVYKEEEMISFAKGIRNKVKMLTEDFDMDSDEETIEAAVKAQERRIRRCF